MSNIRFVTDALNAFAESTKSFNVAFKDAESFRYFLSNFGWELEPHIDEAGFDKVHEAFRAEIALLEQMNGDDAQMAIAAGGLISCLTTSRSANTSWPAPLNSSLFWSEFPTQLLDSFIWQMILSNSSLTYGLLRFGAVLTEIEQGGVEATGGQPSRLSYLKKRIDWGQFVNLLADPENAFKTAYNWNSSTDNFSSGTLLKAISAMFEVLPVASVVLDAPAFLYEKYFDRSLSTSPEKIELLSIMPYMLRDSNGSPIDLLKVSLNVVPIPEEGTNTGSPCGIVIFPIISGSVQTSISLGEGIALLLNGDYSSTPVNAEIRPGSIAIELPGSSNASLAASARLEAQNEATPWIIVGSSDGPRFEVSKAHIEFVVSGTIQNPIFAVRTALDKAALVIDFSSSDGFLHKVFGDTPQHINAELTVGWSSQGGFQISGGAALDLTIPVHETLFDTITIDFVKIKLGTDAADLNTHFNAGVVASLKLGPIDASVNNVGIKLGIKPTTDGSGNIGIFDVSLGFLPPTGAGLAIEAGPIEGGGFLDFDSENERYSGIMALKLGDIGISAIGIITTRMPDGSPGFSMLVNIGVNFEPPIQLAYGFTLSGVGGMIGVNRTLMVDVLSERIKTGSLNSILFPEPEWVIPNAALVISELSTAFPVAEGRFIIGPMVKIGWGSPNIIIGEVGIFVEVPEPVRVIVLGQVDMALPSPSDMIVAVHIDILGTIDFQKRKLSFQSSINGASLLEFEFSGDSAFLVSWGAKPEFALCIGGFHPRFNPPAPSIIFSGLRRLEVNINYGSVVQLGCRGYMAITPNSLQFGARVDVFVSLTDVDIGISGFISFDALIYFSPFSFEAAARGGMSIEALGETLANITVRFNLSGPTPWNMRGNASFSVLAWDIDVDFSITWGREDAVRLDSVDPWPQLEKALLNADSWGSQLPTNVTMVESLRKIEDEPVDTADGEDAAIIPVVVHPAGTLEIRQNVVPLDTTLNKFGNAPVQGHDRFRITKLTTVDRADQLLVEPVMELFARGQFENLSNSERLSLPAFEKMQAGVSTRASSRITIKGATRQTRPSYKSIFLLPDGTSRSFDTQQVADSTVNSWSQTSVLLSGNSTGHCTIRDRGKARFASTDHCLVSTREEAYVIVDGDTLISVELDECIGALRDGMTRVQADQALAQQLTLHPEQTGSLLVVSEFEVEEAA